MGLVILVVVLIVVVAVLIALELNSGGTATAPPPSVQPHTVVAPAATETELFTPLGPPAVPNPADLWKAAVPTNQGAPWGAHTNTAAPKEAKAARSRSGAADNFVGLAKKPTAGPRCFYTGQFKTACGCASCAAARKKN